MFLSREQICLQSVVKEAKRRMQGHPVLDHVMSLDRHVYLIGGELVGCHFGYYPKDYDLVIDTSEEEYQRILETFRAFEGATVQPAGISAHRIKVPGQTQVELWRLSQTKFIVDGKLPVSAHSLPKVPLIDWDCGMLDLHAGTFLGGADDWIAALMARVVGLNQHRVEQPCSVYYGAKILGICKHSSALLSAEVIDLLEQQPPAFWEAVQTRLSSWVVHPRTAREEFAILRDRNQTLYNLWAK